MNILILGVGARERAIQDILRNGNPEASVQLYSSDNSQCFETIKIYIIRNSISLVIPSTEVYLCNGIVDYLEIEMPNIKVFGPNESQSKIEGSKCFSKWCMNELKIPTADHQYFATYLTWIKTDKKNLDPNNIPVLKYSGLAQGKGVYISNTIDEFHENMETLFKLGQDGILLENRLFGTEVSVLAFCNGRNAVLMPQAQDYKSIYDGNKGPNTGGMGAICPANILTEQELLEVQQHMDKIVKRLHYKGVLYAGIMKTTEGIFFLEFNCRFGDPEAQVILNLLDGNLYDIMMNCIDEVDFEVKWKKGSAAAVILAHKDYPLKKLERSAMMTYEFIDKTVKIYDSNVKNMDGMKLTTGGRVLTMVSVDDNLPTALQNIYNNIYKITFSGAYYRRDIGCNNILPKTNNNVAIGIMASGNGTCLDYLFKSNPESVKIIITNNNKNGIYKSAFKYKIPFLYIPHKGETPTKYYEKIVNVFRLYDIEMVILAGYMKIVPETLYSEFTTINIHPSLLPSYSGLMDMVVHESVIKNKELFSGCTLHQVVKDVDKGRILMQKQIKLDEYDTPSNSEYNSENSVSLKQKVQELEKQCIVDFINQYNAYKMKIKYEVDVEQGNDFVNDLKKSISGLGGFCAEYEYKGLRIAAAADGCGTKLDLANTYGKLNTIGIDLVAMSVNDLIAGGAKPLFFMDYIALDKMDRAKCNTIIRGIQTGCLMSECKLIGGETAEMRGTYLKNKLDLAGFAIGEIVFDLPKKDKMREHNIIYGIKSSGVHSNGYTLVNKLLQNSTTQPHIDDLLAPTFIYTNVMKLWKTFPENILGISHITGGGFHDNIIRILPEELYFRLDEWEFPPIFQWIEKESGLNREEMMKTFNCGYGMIIISDIELNLDYDLDLDLGFELEMIGELIKK